MAITSPYTSSIGIHPEGYHLISNYVYTPANTLNVECSGSVYADRKQFAGGYSTVGIYTFKFKWDGKDLLGSTELILKNLLKGDVKAEDGIINQQFNDIRKNQHGYFEK